MNRYRIWDVFVRVFHGALAVGFLINTTVAEDAGTVHIWIGYTLAALVLGRITWGFVGPHHARFASFLPDRKALRDQATDIVTHRRRTRLGHSPLGALMVVNLLGTVLAIAVTGHLIPPDGGWLQNAHEALVGWAIASVVLHIAAVMWESLRTRINLPLAMITGRKQVPDTVDIVE